MISTEASGNEDDPKPNKLRANLMPNNWRGELFRWLSLGAPASCLPRAKGSHKETAESQNFENVAFNDGRQDACAPSVRYSDIALLFRAMTHVQIL